MHQIIDNSPLPNKMTKDRRGQRFNRLLIVAYSHATRSSGAFWRCICDCGNESVVRYEDLRSGHTKSCGCLLREMRGSLHRTHGMSGTVEYTIWKGIETRCYNPNARVYPHYGGRGITMCDRWRTSFENFFSDMGPRPSLKHSIERIDNNGSYSPDNCRWATDLEQANNMRSNRRITFNGKTQSLADWARELDISSGAISLRMARGLSVEEAFSTKHFDNNPNTHRVAFNGEIKTIMEWAVQYNISAPVLYDRLMYGWSIERALTAKVDTQHEGRLLTFNGETKNMNAWAAQIGISASGLGKRFRSGWSIERALTTPVDTRKRR